MIKRIILSLFIALCIGCNNRVVEPPNYDKGNSIKDNSINGMDKREK